MTMDALGRSAGTRTSQRLHEEALNIIPGGVSHNVRFRDPCPIYIDRADGPNMWDVDGNMYVDFWNNHSASLLGHAPEPVVQALREKIEKGLNYGAVNEPGLELAKIVPEFVPSTERLRFCLSGTEATMYAVRLARAFTGREKVIKGIGGWHGANTDLAHVVYPPFDQPTTAGLPPGVANTVHGLRLDSVESVSETLERYGEEIAGIIIDPRRSRLDGDDAVITFLGEQRDDYGFQLIFDEVVTGFRMSPGSYQAQTNVLPDLTTLGKVLGGGLPIGAIAGRAELFERARPDISVDPAERILAGGGTFAMHPMSAVAGLATLRTIKSKPVHEKTEKLAERARMGLREVFADRGVEARVWGLSSLIYVAFNPSRQLTVPADVKVGTDKKALLRFQDELGDRGFFFNPGSGGNVSYAMDTGHIDGLIEAADDAVRSMVTDKLVAND